jgi:two-component system chemotaxis sensor kinase CheA
MPDTSVETSRELLADFVDEALASLQDLASQLDQHRSQPQAPDAINAVFRSIHSIKGCAGFFGLTAVKVFAHALENTLDEVRKGKLTLTEDLQRAFLQGFDLLEGMLQEALDGAVRDKPNAHEQQLLDRIAAIISTVADTADPETLVLQEVLSLADEIAKAAIPQSRGWAERLRKLAHASSAISEDTAANDIDAEVESDQSKTRKPESFLNSRFVCDGEDVTPRLRAVLEMFLSKTYEPAAGVAFETATDEFARWAQSSGRTSLHDALLAAVRDFKLIAASPIEIDAGILSAVWERLAPELTLFAAAFEPAPEATTPPPNATKNSTANSTTPPSAAGNDATAPGAKARLVRVKEEKLDEFLEHVSSLFITGELFKDLHARMATTNQLSPLVEEMRQIHRALSQQSTSLQQSVVALRRVSVAGLFSKFPRMARGLAEQLQKKIDVHITGEEIEIDKTLVEDLDAPLTHMIRNVVDHGIETPDERLKRGVSEVGNLWLHAEQTRTHVRVIIRDDGRGIDPVRLRRKAIEKGLMPAAQVEALSDRQAVDLIFHAGFSTAEKLTDVSGRGVGMDVVRTKIREHGGEVIIESRVGVGTTVTLEIPIRNAVLVIDGLMLRQSGQDFVLPFEHILEITELSPEDLYPVQGANVARLRGSTYDAVPLATILSLAPGNRGLEEPWQAVLVGCKEGSLCLLVDQVFGHRQVVVNHLQDVLPGQERLAGVAQLGGGRLALVLSVPDIIKRICGQPE